MRGVCPWQVDPYCYHGHHPNATRDALATLGLNERGTNVNKRAVERAYHDRARETHPDKEKDPALRAEKAAEFRKVADAKDWLLTIFRD